MSDILKAIDFTQSYKRHDFWTLFRLNRMVSSFNCILILGYLEAEGLASPNDSYTFNVSKILIAMNIFFFIGTGECCSCSQRWSSLTRRRYQQIIPTYTCTPPSLSNDNGWTSWHIQSTYHSVLQSITCKVIYYAVITQSMMVMLTINLKS